MLGGILLPKCFAISKVLSVSTPKSSKDCPVKVSVLNIKLEIASTYKPPGCKGEGTPGIPTLLSLCSKISPPGIHLLTSKYKAFPSLSSKGILIFV